MSPSVSPTRRGTMDGDIVRYPYTTYGGDIHATRGTTGTGTSATIRTTTTTIGGDIITTTPEATIRHHVHRNIVPAMVMTM